jgi:toxin ParE1/3/4
VKLVWSPQADDDLDEIVRYIALDSVNAALRTQDRIEQAIGRLEEMPRVGRPGRVVGTRELVVTGTPYIVIYLVSDDEIGLSRIIHGAQRWPPADEN